MLDIALLIWATAAAVALTFRLLMLGAELSDFEALVARGRNGLTRIESIQHIRTEAMWVVVAFCFLSIGLLVTVDPPWRGEASRWLLVLSSVCMAVAPIWDWWDRRRKLTLTVRELQADTARRVADLDSERKAYQGMTEEAITRLELAAAKARAERGEPPMPLMADVVPEHSSPITPAQQDTADLQTMRARLTAATLGLGQPPREAASPDAGENPEPAS